MSPWSRMLQFGRDVELGGRGAEECGSEATREWWRALKEWMEGWESGS
jgi:hypothetical protein